MRTEVSKKMHIRKAPRFIFVEDDGAAYAAHINELLRTLNVNGDAEEDLSARRRPKNNSALRKGWIIE